MIVGAWVLVLGLLTIAFTDVLDYHDRPNRELVLSAATPSEVTLRRNRHGQYLAEGAINQRRVTFLVDTGATLVSVPLRLARRLGLRRGAAVSIETANGKAQAFLTRLDSVSLGKIELQDIRALINPGQQGEEILLGMSFLKRLEFTQKGRELTIRQVAQPSTTNRYSAPEG